MTRWPQGEATIERMISTGHLQMITGVQANGPPWLDKAAKTLHTAQGIIEDDPESAYILVYDAVRHACTGLLAQQGLRPTTAGGHYAVEEAVRAQFGSRFKPLGTLRRRRNELEYPAYPGDHVDEHETRDALADAHTMLEATSKLLPHLGFFETP